MYQELQKRVSLVQRSISELNVLGISGGQEYHDVLREINGLFQMGKPITDELIKRYAAAKSQLEETASAAGEYLRIQKDIREQLGKGFSNLGLKSQFEDLEIPSYGLHINVKYKIDTIIEKIIFFIKGLYFNQIIKIYRFL